jgi:hypothetical protein
MSFHECPVPTLMAQHVDEVGFEEDKPRHSVGMIEGQPHGDRSGIVTARWTGWDDAG